ncbi:MAG: hypothetical protein KDH88_05210 [Chromatiales bacterium]|nr:hypothetical protein [Chromatiales bacterium]
MQRWFGVRPGEWRGLAWFFCLFSLLSIGAAIARGIAFTLLVGEYGREVLPAVFIAVDLCVTGGSLAYLRWSRRHGAIAVMMLFLLTAMVLSISAAALFSIHPRSGALYWFVGFFAIHVLIVVHLGTLLATYYDAAQQKRLSGLIYAGMPVGGMLGGALLVPLLAVFQPRDLIPALAITAVLGLALVRHLGNVSTPVLAPAGRGTRSIVAELAEGARFVRGSSLLRWMALGVALFVVAGKLLEFQYHGLIYPAAYPDLTERAAFFGRYEVVANGLWLLFQVLFASRIIIRLGVGGANIAHPAMLAIASLGLMANFGLAAGLTAQFVNQEMRGAIRAPAQALLFNGVPPDRWATSKAFINGLVYPLATLSAGALLMILQAQTDADGLSRVLPLLTLLLAVTGVLAGLPQWRAYRQSVLGLLMRARSGAGRDPDESLRLALLGQDRALRLIALEQIARLRAEKLLPAVGRLLLSSRDRQIKRQCARTLASFADSELALGYLLRALRFESDAEVLVPLLEQLGIMGRHDSRSAVERFLLHPSSKVFAAAVGALMNNRRFNPDPVFRARILSRLDTRDEHALLDYLQAVSTLGDRALADRLLPFQAHASEAVRVAAFHARTRLLSGALDAHRQEWIQALERPERPIRLAALKALSACGPLPDWMPVVILLGSADRAEQKAAAGLLRLHRKTSEKTLWEYALDVQTGVRARRAALELLQGHLEHVRRSALAGLARTRLADALGMQLLGDALERDGWGSNDHRPYLLRLLREGRERALGDVLAIAAKLGNQPGDFVERISAGLRDADAHRRGLVLEAVADCGAQEVIPRLLDLIETRNAPEAGSRLYAQWTGSNPKFWLADIQQALRSLRQPYIDELLALRVA